MYGDKTLDRIISLKWRQGSKGCIAIIWVQGTANFSISKGGYIFELKEDTQFYPTDWQSLTSSDFTVVLGILCEDYVRERGNQNWGRSV